MKLHPLTWKPLSLIQFVDTQEEMEDYSSPAQGMSLDFTMGLVLTLNVVSRTSIKVLQRHRMKLPHVIPGTKIGKSHPKWSYFFLCRQTFNKCSFLSFGLGEGENYTC